MPTKKYKYQLLKGSAKYLCPNCGHRTFVPYVDANNGIVNIELYGRCDRENNCGYILYPKGEQAQPTTRAKIQPPPPRPILLFDNAILAISFDSPLFAYACKIIGVSKAIHAFQRYKVGAYMQHTIFWQIDANGKVRGGKLIPYADNGHRKKDTTPVRWAHKLPTFASHHNNGELCQCFFGEHLLSDDVANVIIVESEKTALLMSEICHKERTFLATGGSGNLKTLCEQATKKGLFLHKKVLLVPDNGQVANWAKIGLKYGFKTYPIAEIGADGADILDIYEDFMLNTTKYANDRNIIEYCSNLHPF